MNRNGIVKEKSIRTILINRSGVNKDYINKQERSGVGCTCNPRLEDYRLVSDKTVSK